MVTRHSQSNALSCRATDFFSLSKCIPNKAGGCDQIASGVLNILANFHYEDVKPLHACPFKASTLPEVWEVDVKPPFLKPGKRETK